MGSFLDVIHGLISNNTRGNQNQLTPSSASTNLLQGGSGGQLSVQNGASPTQFISSPQQQIPLTQPQLNGVNLTSPSNGTVLGASTTAVPNSAPAAPAADPLASLRNDVLGRIQSIQSAYNALNGGIDSQVGSQAQQLKQNYGTQLSNLNNAYQNTQNQEAGIFNARGLQDSSFYGNAQQNAGNTYTQNNQSILQNENNSLGQLGQYASSAKAGNAAGAQTYADIGSNIGQYDQTGLQNLQSSLYGLPQHLQSQLAGLGGNSQFVNGLNQITPVQNTGTDQLGQQLQTLVTSAAPQFAKNQIAQGLIKQAQLTDPNAQNYWQNYYQQLLGSQGA